MKSKKIENKRSDTSRLSSPKVKLTKEKALARWGDGLFYIVNIVQVIFLTNKPFVMTALNVGGGRG